MSEIKRKRDEIDSAADLRERIETAGDLSGWVVQGVDLTEFGSLEGVGVSGTMFLGCQFEDDETSYDLQRRGADVFAGFERLPYYPYRTELYSVPELLAGYEAGGYTNTTDFVIYEHFDRHRNHDQGVPIREALAQRIHDHAIDDALEELLHGREHRGVVGVMGGHGTERTDPYYRKVARLTWGLTREGYFVASGGGPGIMEAANLGAYLANYAEAQVVDHAIEILSEAPKFDGGQREGTPEYLEAIRRYIGVARQVIDTFSGSQAGGSSRDTFRRERHAPGESLAVPTWFYGHEPTNLFSTHIAKYFSNSIREDGLLAIAKAGVVFAPGSAGTMQEIFVDLAQNHYATFRFRSPMVFLGEKHYASIYELLMQFVRDRGKMDLYGDLIALFEAEEDVITHIASHPPRQRLQTRPLYELVSDG